MQNAIRILKKYWYWVIILILSVFAGVMCVTGSNNLRMFGIIDKFVQKLRDLVKDRNREIKVIDDKIAYKKIEIYNLQKERVFHEQKIAAAEVSRIENEKKLSNMTEEQLVKNIREKIK